MTDGRNREQIRPRRPRADAVRNERRIMETAIQLFAERGLDVSLDQVAQVAGVGVGTVYRRFGSRPELIRAVFAEHVRAVTELSESAATQEDPWSGLVELLEYVCKRMASDRGFAALVINEDAEFTDSRQAAESAVSRVIERAHASGQLRSDVGIGDFAGLLVMVNAVADFTRPVDATMWRRFFGIMLNGLRSQEDGRHPLLPASAMSLDQIHAAQRAHASKRRG